MIVLAGTQTAMVAPPQPLFDVVPTAPDKHEPPPTHTSREQAGRDRALTIILERDRPENQRGWIARTVGGGIQRVANWCTTKPRAHKVRMLVWSRSIRLLRRSVTAIL